MRIVFEGGDGSGKSSQTELFVKRFMQEYPDIPIRLTHEPRVLRSDIMGEIKNLSAEDQSRDSYISYLFGKDGYMDRQEELTWTEPVIVRDRDTSISQYAYHHGFGTSDELIYLISWMANQINGVDLVFFVDVPVDVALERINKRSPEKPVDQYFEKKEKLEKIRENYLSLFQDQKRKKLMGISNAFVYIIDGQGTIQDIHERIWEFFQNFEWRSNVQLPVPFNTRNSAANS